MARQIPNKALVLDNPKVDMSVGQEDRRKVQIILYTQHPRSYE